MEIPTNSIPRVLTTRDLAALNAVLQSCNTTTCLIEALKQLGLDCSEIEATNNQHVQFAAKAKALFFPDQP